MFTYHKQFYVPSFESQKTRTKKPVRRLCRIHSIGGKSESFPMGAGGLLRAGTANTKFAPSPWQTSLIAHSVPPSCVRPSRATPVGGNDSKASPLWEIPHSPACSSGQATVISHRFLGNPDPPFGQTWPVWAFFFFLFLHVNQMSWDRALETLPKLKHSVDETNVLKYVTRRPMRICIGVMTN